MPMSEENIISRINPEDPRVEKAQCSHLKPVDMVLETPYFNIMKRDDYYSYEPLRPQLAVLPVVARTGIVMIRSFRPLIADCPLELPAGGMEEGENVQEAALRELKEETGIIVNDPSRLRRLLPLASVANRFPMLDNIFTISLTRDEFNNRLRHCDETHSVNLFTFEEVMTKIIDGEIYTALPIAVILRFMAASKVENSNR